ncbi:ABC transporter ATP-binding protein [Kineosporia sp. A_224]|uniref:ABC transporter ATP-binding protein n=1 Tax=Kineosporia sp. A_224 TaxID=1962180 RepID=UPI000B4B9DB6|nr:ABC transporter ATP-binding protein [Kineosporia sp. A_224]
MGTPAIRTDHLTKRYGDVLALDGLDLEVQPGEVFGFLGPNGAGKTTTVRLLLSLLRPTAGRAWVMGVPVEDVVRAHRHLGYVPGEVALWPQLTGAETLELLGNVAGGVDTALRDELVERFRLDPGLRVRAYSKGNRQKVMLVAAFMTRPDVLLLDEPTAGLDPLMEAEFQALVREAAAQGRTVFLSSHLLDEVEDVCTRVAILREGRLVEVATLDALRRMGSLVLDAEFDGGPDSAAPDPADLAALPGVVSAEPHAGGLRVVVAGSPAPVLARLAAAGVARLHSHEPTLEEVFLGYYEATAGQQGAVAAAHDRGL